jgi:hypothetical protein
VSVLLAVNGPGNGEKVVELESEEPAVGVLVSVPFTKFPEKAGALFVHVTDTTTLGVRALVGARARTLPLKLMVTEELATVVTVTIKDPSYGAVKAKLNDELSGSGPGKFVTVLPSMVTLIE